MGKLDAVLFYVWTLGNHLHQEHPDMSILDFFKKFGSLVKQALGIVKDVIPEETLRLALVWVRVAATKYVDNAQRREWVVQILKDKGVSESIARLAVELAVRLFKSEVNKIS